MSKQLAISAAFCTFAMAAFSLTATASQPNPPAAMQTGAETHATAPAASPSVTGLLDLIR